MDLYFLLKKRVALLWLKKSWSAFVFFIIFSSFIIFALEPLVKKFVPPDKPETKEILGFIKIQKKPEGPSRADKILKKLTPWMWALNGVTFIFLMIRKIKPTLTESEEYSKILQSAAKKSLSDNEINKGVNLMKKAIEYSTDPESSVTLSKELKEIETYSLTYTRGEGTLDSKIASFQNIMQQTIVDSLNFLDKGKLLIINVIGSGGMGKVFLAEHTMLRRKVAVKELAPHLLTLWKGSGEKGRHLPAYPIPTLFRSMIFLKKMGRVILLWNMSMANPLTRLLKKRR